MNIGWAIKTKSAIREGTGNKMYRMLNVLANAARINSNKNIRLIFIFQVYVYML
jgi:hypothetical protein